MNDNTASPPNSSAAFPAGAGAPEIRIPFRGGGFAPQTSPWGIPATCAALLLAWQGATHAGWVDATLLPPPAEVLTSLVALVRDGDLARHTIASFQRLLLGWLVGASCGILVGVLIGLSSFARATALPLVSALFAVPKIALLPLFIVWLGVGEASKITTIAVGVFSPMVFAAFGGVDGVDRRLIRMAQSFNMHFMTIVRHIVLPGALPSLLSGARVSASIGIVLLTAAEMIGAQHGIGAFILRAGNLMRTDQLLTGVVLLAAVGIGASQMLSAAERTLLRWRRG